jgi:hypothetical protein
VGFCGLRLKFALAVRFVSAAQMGPADLKNWAADFLGQVLDFLPW